MVAHCFSLKMLVSYSWYSVYVSVYAVVKLLTVILLNISVIMCYNVLMTLNNNK